MKRTSSLHNAHKKLVCAPSERGGLLEASVTALAFRKEESQECYNNHNHKMWCLTGAEATTTSGALPPSTRAFGRVPLTGKVTSREDRRSGLL